MTKCAGKGVIIRYAGKAAAFVLLPVLILLALAACGTAEDSEDGPVTLVYATLTPRSDLWTSVEEFNASHRDVQIEVKDYSEYTDGLQQMFKEMIAGNIPDIFDLGVHTSSMPYQRMAKKGYFEDLWPWIENDPELGRDALMEAPLRSAEIDGHLYAAFSSVSIETLLGPVSAVGDRTSWSLEDLRTAYAAMPDGTELLPPYYTKEAVLYYVVSMSVDNYVDWGTGECRFDCPEFRTALTFCNENFPLEYDWSQYDGFEDCEDLENGKQLLLNMQFSSYEYVMICTQLFQIAFQSQMAYVGFPVEDGSVGSSFWISGERLAMSATCKDKEAAWEYIRRLLLPQYTGDDVNADAVWDQRNRTAFPVNRQDFRLVEAAAKLHQNMNPTTYSIYSSYLFREYMEPVEYTRFRDFFNSIQRSDLLDSTIYSIIRSQAAPYFAGDITLDEVVQNIQNRVDLYVNEQK